MNRKDLMVFIKIIYEFYLFIFLIAERMNLNIDYDRWRRASGS
jgi:hypothetical protein